MSESLVKVDSYDVLGPVGLRFSISNLVLSTGVHTAKSRWKTWGGEKDPLREQTPELRISETIHGEGEVHHELLVIGRPRKLLKRLSRLTFESASEFDGTQWEHSRGWLKCETDEVFGEGWECWFAVPFSAFQSLKLSLQRGCVGKVSLFANLLAHGPRHEGSWAKIPSEGTEIFLIDLSWEEDFNSIGEFEERANN